jgi:hypothetical protein
MKLYGQFFSCLMALFLFQAIKYSFGSESLVLEILYYGSFALEAIRLSYCM